MKNPKHYVDPKVFYDLMVRYKKDLKEYRKKIKDDKARLMNKDYEQIGKYILDIATRLASSPNFRQYSWKDEMINEGIMDCIKYLENFNEKKYKNPFTYYTQICWYGALRRISAEKKQIKLKGKLILNSGILDTFELTDKQLSDDSEYNQALSQYLKQYIEKAGDDEKKTPNKFKKTTRAYQKKMKELEEKEKIMEDSIKETPDERVEDDEDYDYKNEYDDLYSEDYE